MTVLHLITGRGPTGPAAAAMSDVQALRAAGHTAYIATRDGTPLMQACTAANLPALGGLRLGRGAMRLLHLPRDAQRLRAIVRDCNIDVIHVHRTDDQLLAAAALGRKLSARLVRTWHRDPRSGSSLFLTRLAKNADGCVCVSRDAVDALKGAGAPRSEYIPVGVDTTVFTPSPTTDPRPEPIIGQVGRFKRDRDGRDRGQRAALEVFALLPRTLAWRGMLVGRGEMEGALKVAAFDELQLPRNRVEIMSVPAQSSANFAAILAALALGLVFQTGSDGTSRAAAELLACGVPLIVADIPGLRELAEDSACASRQLPSDPHGWARAVEALLREPEKLAAMRAAARARAEAVHGLAVRGAALAEFYRGL